MAGRDTDTGGGRRGGWAPYLLTAPGLLWLFFFFLIPLYFLARTALSVKENRFDVFPDFAWEWANFSTAWDEYREQFVRSFLYAALATIAALLIGYPLAYVIATRGGRFKNFLLGLVVVPFFTTFLIRTLSWRSILSTEGWVVQTLRDIGILGDNQELLYTPLAVIGGLTYNFLPFMVLPIYVAIEKIDLRLVDAAQDLFATGWQAFRKVVLPLSMPGVFAGSLLVFIPAAGDFVNWQYLGGRRAELSMIGSVVQDQFLVQNNYPIAAALSFVFMAIVLVIVLVYARLLGTEELA